MRSRATLPSCGSAASSDPTMMRIDSAAPPQAAVGERLPPLSASLPLLHSLMRERVRSGRRTRTARSAEMLGTPGIALMTAEMTTMKSRTLKPSRRYVPRLATSPIAMIFIVASKANIAVNNGSTDARKALIGERAGSGSSVTGSTALGE